VQLHAEEQGEGPCAVFVHGFGGDFCSWDGLWPLLQPGRRLLRYDLRGFGRSVAMSGERFTHTGDLVTLLAGRSIARCDLIGVSMGGGLALSFALDHPDIVRSLTLISPQISGWEWSEPWRAEWAKITGLARAGRVEEAKELWWLHPLFESTRGGPAGAKLRQEIEAFAGRQWVRDDHAMVLPDIERLHELAVPTLLLSGGLDVAEFRLMADIIEVGAETVRRIDIEGAGHMLHMEVPELCARHIDEFLEAQT